VLVNLEDPGLVAHARSVPTDLPATASKISGLAMVGRLKTLAVRLRAAGVEVVDVPADRLAMGMIEAYFRHKARAGSGRRSAG